MQYFGKNNPVSTILFTYKMYNYTIIESGFAYSTCEMV